MYTLQINDEDDRDDHYDDDDDRFGKRQNTRLHIVEQIFSYSCIPNILHSSTQQGRIFNLIKVSQDHLACKINFQSISKVFDNSCSNASYLD